MTDHIISVIGLLSDAIHCAKTGDSIGLVNVLRQLEQLFATWREEIEK